MDLASNRFPLLEPTDGINTGEILYNWKTHGTLLQFRLSYLVKKTPTPFIKRSHSRRHTSLFPTGK
ncbi:unnamed protein product [Tuber melanosporum]|uniref:(Perigord truffle) hypothetical protein n=1 Tax=Tuber melanosporum (strain Mel28) TaxID=656061 RepID=D5GAM3_TUBMM|nr:uncharacterized protein GSTUM_00003682001 [Tuber melanosporum]CAZ81566.1 unnamed protein product [Tuber melanosporum]